jgi:hypothetical protein
MSLFTYINNEYDDFMRFLTTVVLLWTQLFGPRRWRKLGMEMVDFSLLVTLNNSGVGWFNGKFASIPQRAANLRP